MVEILIVSIISFFFLVLLPRIRQLDDDLDKKYEEKNKWKEKITQHYNGHHNQVNSFGYQDYKDSFDINEHYDYNEDKYEE